MFHFYQEVEKLFLKEKGKTFAVSKVFLSFNWNLPSLGRGGDFPLYAPQERLDSLYEGALFTP